MPQRGRTNFSDINIFNCINIPLIFRSPKDAKEFRRALTHLRVADTVAKAKGTCPPELLDKLYEIGCKCVNASPPVENESDETDTENDAIIFNQAKQCSSETDNDHLVYDDEWQVL